MRHLRRGGLVCRFITCAGFPDEPSCARRSASASVGASRDSKADLYASITCGISRNTDAAVAIATHDCADRDGSGTAYRNAHADAEHRIAHQHIGADAKYATTYQHGNAITAEYGVGADCHASLFRFDLDVHCA